MHNMDVQAPTLTATFHHSHETMNVLSFALTLAETKTPTDSTSDRAMIILPGLRLTAKHLIILLRPNRQRHKDRIPSFTHCLIQCPNETRHLLRLTRAQSPLSHSLQIRLHNTRLRRTRPTRQHLTLEQSSLLYSATLPTRGGFSGVVIKSNKQPLLKPLKLSKRILKHTVFRLKILKEYSQRAYRIQKRKDGRRCAHSRPSSNYNTRGPHLYTTFARG